MRAYMAGVVTPTIVVCAVAIAVGFRFARIPRDVERAMVFPMAIIPLTWGAWDALYIVVRRASPVPLGWFGALLPVLLIPGGVVLAHGLGLTFVTVKGALIALPPTMVAYVVLWKYVVGFLNRLVGVPD
jgi:hypothetical protein